jgi:hypothetical protein
MLSTKPQVFDKPAAQSLLKGVSKSIRRLAAKKVIRHAGHA